MANLPRFLPLVFVAIGGVLAMKAVSSVDSLPDMLKSARAAFAEEAARLSLKPNRRLKRQRLKRQRQRPRGRTGLRPQTL